MHEIVKVKKGGTLEYKKWDAEKGSSELVDVTDKLDYFAIHYVCNLEDGVTIGDILKVVEKNKGFLKKISNSYLDELLAEAFSPLSDKQAERMSADRAAGDYVSNCVIKHICDYTPDISEDIETYVCFGGEGPTTDEYCESGWTNWALSCTPANELVDLPIKLDTKFEIGTSLKKDGYKYEKIFEAKKQFTLLDVFNAIVWELTWHGTPEMRDEFVEEMNERVSEVGNNDGAIPWEEFKKEFLKDKEE